jgi:uncharacterized repeat protein (TIGR03803 family)
MAPPSRQFDFGWTGKSVRHNLCWWHWQFRKWLRRGVQIQCAHQPVDRPAHFLGTGLGAPASALEWDSNGNLYGATTLAGAYGYGNVFKLDPSGNFTSLHDFTGGADGAKPYAGVIVDAKGNVWGAASAGGSNTSPGGYGTIFIITPPTT